VFQETKKERKKIQKKYKNHPKEFYPFFQKKFMLDADSMQKQSHLFSEGTSTLTH